MSVGLVAHKQDGHQLRLERGFILAVAVVTVLFALAAVATSVLGNCCYYVLYLPTGAAACWASVRALRHHPGHPRAGAWRALAVGMFLTLTAELLRLVGYLSGAPLEWAWAVVHVLSFPFYLAMHLIRLRAVLGRGGVVAALLDATTVTTVVGALSAELLAPHVTSPGGATGLALVVPPLAAVAMLGLALFLVYLSPKGQRSAPLALAATATTALPAAWLLAALGSPTVPASAPYVAGALLAVAFAFLAALPTLDLADQPPVDPTGAPQLPRALQALPLVLLTGLVLVVTANGLWPALIGLETHRMLERALLLATVLVLLRQWIVLRLNQQLTRHQQSLYARLEAAHRAAQLEARTDPLTGLPNQRLLREQLEPTLAFHQRTRRPLAILYIDIDDFKAYNDLHGHASGDMTLVEVATRLRDEPRQGDIVARFGGEEFVIMLPDTSAEGAIAVAERLRQHVSGQPVKLADGCTPTITISVGVAEYPRDAATVADLLAAADAALRAAKAAGRNRVVDLGPAMRAHGDA